MKSYQVIQYSPEYWDLKRGVPSASNFDRIITSKGALSKSCDKYIAELLAERVALNPNFFTERPGHTAAMRNGLDTEPEARRYYQMERNCEVQPGGWVTTDDGRIGQIDLLQHDGLPGLR